MGGWAYGRMGVLAYGHAHTPTRPHARPPTRPDSVKPHFGSFRASLQLILLAYASLAPARRNGRPARAGPRGLRGPGLPGLGRGEIAAADGGYGAQGLRADRGLAVEPAGQERPADASRD